MVIIDLFHFMEHTRGYNYKNQSSARQGCERIGAQLGSKAMLSEALNSGLECCSCNWISGQYNHFWSDMIMQLLRLESS